MSIRALAEASIETTEAFLASRASLRTRMVSIYTNEATNGMDPVCILSKKEHIVSYCVPF